VFFPQKSGQIPDRPALTLVVMPSDMSAEDASTRKALETMASDSGQSARTFKSGLIWAVAEDAGTIWEEARKVLAWRDIDKDDDLKLDETQRRQLSESLKRAERDLREAVWRAYKNIFLLGDDNQLRRIDLGLVHSSAASSLVELILNRLKQEDIVVPSVAPTFLTRYWPPALPEWSTKSVRDAFCASPRFPRLVSPEAVKDTVSKGLDGGHFAYVGKAGDGSYQPFVFKKSLPASEVEIADDVFLIRRDLAEAYLAGKVAPPVVVAPPVPPTPPVSPDNGGSDGGTPKPQVGGGGGTITVEPEPPVPTTVQGLSWSGEVPPSKWMNFYTRVLAKFATGGGMRIVVSVEIEPSGGMAKTSVDETQVALRELKLEERVTLKPTGGDRT
jgi:hypothetical protein